MSLSGKHYVAALVWCALLAAMYFVIDDQLAPKVATASGASTEIRVPRSRDGHFYVAGQINGQAIVFMVDTGATTVAVGQAAARRIGLPSGRTVTVGTAGGVAIAEEVTGQTLVIGGILVRDVRILVLPDLSGAALLGQNVLRHLAVEQTAGEMVLRARH